MDLLVQIIQVAWLARENLHFGMHSNWNARSCDQSYDRSWDTPKQISEETLAAIEKIVCQIYQLHTLISRVNNLHWWLFKKKQEQSE